MSKVIDKFSPSDVARMLAEQHGKSADFFMDKIREDYAKGLLRFWLRGGTPADYRELADSYPLPYEYSLGLDNEYTTKKAIDAWLEAWGAEYRFNGSSEQPKPKKTAYQAQLIIEAIEGLGYNPQQLPKTTGHAGVKKQVREQLDGRYPFDSRTAFNTAWKDSTKTER